MGKHKEKSKKHRKEKHHKKSRKSSTSGSSSDEWVEKKSVPQEVNRDEWMSLPTSFMSTSHTDKRSEREKNKRLEREAQKYNPAQCSRELNPYWKDGGDGLPKFQKPSDSDENKPVRAKPSAFKSSWRKPAPVEKTVYSDRDEGPKQETETQGTITNGELNVLAAKLVKAEIMGDESLIRELKVKLENAKRLTISEESSEAQLLTQTNSRGVSRPVKLQQSGYGGGASSSQGRNKKRKIETHAGGDRVCYFPDDDNRSLQEMFENEKYSSVDDANLEFIKMVGKVGKNDDLDDVFTDNIRKAESSDRVDRNNRNKAISEHRQMSEALDSCVSCLQSAKMQKHLLVATTETFYLSLPAYEPLSENHCIVAPIRHASCSTQLEENEWSELIRFRQALTSMFRNNNQDVIFFETAMFLHRFPHMNMHCVPVDEETGSLAPIYFKKAIEESEAEWASNKKLVSLKGRDVRRAIPKGLPYFSVSFGMEEGFAHVIEDQRLFPANFAQEIIGGILDLHHSKWRKPKMQKFDEQNQRTAIFGKKWGNYDFTKT